MHTMDLWQKALNTGTNAAQWAERLGIDKSTLTHAKNKRHLSTTLAGKVALALGENPKDWIAVAAIEEIAIKDPETAKQLKRQCQYS